MAPDLKIYSHNQPNVESKGIDNASNQTCLYPHGCMPGHQALTGRMLTVDNLVSGILAFGSSAGLVISYALNQDPAGNALE